MALFYSCVPVIHDSVAMNQDIQYRDPETEAAKWNTAIINLIIYTCAPPVGVNNEYGSDCSDISVISVAFEGKEEPA